MSTAENADEVVVVDKGRIVQRGPHAALVAEGGVYGRLHASWVAQQSVRADPGRRRVGSGIRRPGYWRHDLPRPRPSRRASSATPRDSSPAVVQQHDTGEVLMVGWMDDEALHRTLTTGRTTFWSRSRQELLGQGRDVRPPPARQGGPPRLRRRHPARQGRPGGAGLPHRRPHLLRRHRRSRSPMAERAAQQVVRADRAGRARRRRARRGRRRPRTGRRAAGTVGRHPGLRAPPRAPSPRRWSSLSRWSPWPPGASSWCCAAGPAASSRSSGCSPPPARSSPRSSPTAGRRTTPSRPRSRRAPAPTPSRRR